MSEELQPTLFELPEKVKDQLDHEGRYTAERLFAQRHDTYLTIVHLLSEGQSIRAIKRACRVHHETIAAVAVREQIAIDTGKERVVATLALGITALADSLVEDIMEDRLKPAEKAITLAIMVDKKELLSGGVTARVETTGSNDKVKNWDEWLDRMKRVPGMDRTGEEGGQKATIEVRTHALAAPPAPTQTAPASEPVTPLESPASDRVSDDCPVNSGSVSVSVSTGRNQEGGNGTAERGSEGAGGVESAGPANEAAKGSGF